MNETLTNRINYHIKELSELLGEKIREENKFIPTISRISTYSPVWDSNEMKAMLETISNQWFIYGLKSFEFEKEFAKLLGKKYSIFVNSGSSANLIAMFWLKESLKNINNNEQFEIITSTTGFSTTLSTIIQAGFKSVFVDASIGDYNIAVNNIEKNITKNTKAIFVAHMLGRPCEMSKIMEICDKYNLILIEDCCEALGSTYKNKLVGSFGKISTCSTFAAHNITTFEGGIVATDDEEVYTIIRKLRDWGRGCTCLTKNKVACGNRHRKWFEDIEELKDTEFDHRYVFDISGFNLKSTELQAVVGLEQIKKSEKFNQIRKYNYSRLCNIFSKYEQYFLILPYKDNVVPFAFPIYFNTVYKNKFEYKEHTGKTAVITYLEDNKIQTRNLMAGNLLVHKAFRQYDDYKKYQNSTLILKNVFLIGCHQGIDEEMLNYIESVIDNMIKEIYKET